MTSRHAQSELRVGLFVLTFLALLAGSMIYIGIQKDLFAERFSFLVISTTGENVERGVPLVLSGFRVGQVADVDLTQVGKVVIEVEMLEKYHEWLRTDSQIILVQGGFIGKTYLQLVPGTQSAAILEDGASVDLNRVGGLDDIIAEARPVIEDLKSIVANVREITESLLDDKGSVQRTLANLEGISTDLRSEGGPRGLRDPRPPARGRSWTRFWPTRTRPWPASRPWWNPPTTGSRTWSRSRRRPRPLVGEGARIRQGTQGIPRRPAPGGWRIR